MRRWIVVRFLLGVQVALVGCGGEDRILYTGPERPERVRLEVDRDVWAATDHLFMDPASWPLKVNRGEVWCDGSGAIWLTTDDGKHWPLDVAASFVAPVLGEPFQTSSDDVLKLDARMEATWPDRDGTEPVSMGFRRMEAAARAMCE